MAVAKTQLLDWHAARKVQTNYTSNTDMQCWLMSILVLECLLSRILAYQTQYSDSF